MLELGLGSSHVWIEDPIDLTVKRFEAVSKWHDWEGYEPPRYRRETPEILQDYLKRCNAAFNTLRQQLESYEPDALIMIGDDQGQMFDNTNNPTFSIFTGEGGWGMAGGPMCLPPDQPRHRVDYKFVPSLAREIASGLVKRDFDVATLEEFVPRGQPENGMSHMVANLTPMVDPNNQIPIIPIFLNEYYPPLPSAKRCFDLGVALAEILRERPERVAIYASGGLSHLGFGGLPTSYIDEPLDRWFLERIERNDSMGLKNLYTVESDTLNGGTGEIRAWISVAGAMDRRATIIDYMPIWHSMLGVGFAYWGPTGA